MGESFSRVAVEDQRLDFTETDLGAAVSTGKC